MTQVKAHCPNCGSTDIQLKRNTKTISVRAHESGSNITVTKGKTREDLTNYCLNCGNTWNAEYLYNKYTTHKRAYRCHPRYVLRKASRLPEVV